MAATTLGKTAFSVPAVVTRDQEGVAHDGMCGHIGLGMCSFIGLLTLVFVLAARESTLVAEASGAMINIGTTIAKQPVPHKPTPNLATARLPPPSPQPLPPPPQPAMKLPKLPMPADCKVNVQGNPARATRRPHGLGGKESISDVIERATRPSVTDQECSGFDTTWTYAWCCSVLANVVKSNDVLGLSYGIFTWDKWSKGLSNTWRVPTRLYDCFSTEAKAGKLTGYETPYKRYDVCLGGHTSLRYIAGGMRQFESFKEHMERRPPRGTFVKMDIEGSEWEALESVTDEQLQKIDIFDFEFHFCDMIIPASLPHRVQVLRDRARTMERLHKLFAVTQREPEDVGAWTGPSPHFEDDALCTGRVSLNMADIDNSTCQHLLKYGSKQNRDWKFCTGWPSNFMATMTYVNRRYLEGQGVQ